MEKLIAEAKCFNVGTCYAHAILFAGACLTWYNVWQLGTRESADFQKQSADFQLLNNSAFQPLGRNILPGPT